MGGHKVIAMDQKKKGIKMAVSMVAAIFLVCLYVAIFLFSGQDGETSGRLSHEVTKVIVEKMEDLARKTWTEEWKASVISYWENPVRKLAHFSEYAGMGILVFLLWMPWMKKCRQRNGLVILWVLLSAALDEWHQTFIIDRCGNVFDVLLDTAGGSFGLLLCLLVEKVLGRKKHR